MRKVAWAVGVVAACTGLAVGSVAAAAPPVKTPVPFHQTFTGYAGACDFPLTITFNTQQTMREWKSPDGSVLRMFVTGNGSVSLTNEQNGHAITVNASGPTLDAKGTGNWVFIGTQAQADFLPFPPGAWLYSGRIGNLNASDYGKVFKGNITDLCAAVS